jgi:arginyl-tRNA synthetase
MLQDILQELDKEIKSWLSEAGVGDSVVVIERSSSPEFGEFSTNVAMRYAKELKSSPVDLAEKLVIFLQGQKIECLEKAEFVKPGFVNIYLTPEAKIQHLNDIIKRGPEFGKNTSHQGEKWVIEHTSPNPNKAMHLGHLLNNLVGMSIVRMLKASGAEVASDAIYNNRGIAIAKVMYGYLANMKKSADTPTDIKYWVEHSDEWFTPEEKDLKPDAFVTKCYVLGEKDTKDNKESEQTLRQMVVDWEAGDESVMKLWKYVLQIAYTGIDATLARLDSHWDKVWYEHEHYEKGKKYVEQGLEKGIFQKLEDGAVLTNLEEDYEKIPDTILLKNDGTSLYITQDIALTDLKKKTYGADKLVWVIGPDQSMAMKQMFAVCEQLGIGKVEDFTHVPYGYVSLRGEDGSFKKMSSREGTVVLIDDVIDEVKSTIRARFDSEEKHEPEVRVSLSEKLALCAVKFAFLKSDRKQDVSLDIEQSVDVQGDSGMYVMYTFVRTQSILRKAVSSGDDLTNPPSGLGEEADLVRTLLYFEAVVEKSVKDLSVHHVSQYLLELCSEFNSWYAKETVLDGSDKEAYKLAVVNATAVTIKNGLALLGIETVDEM